MFFWSGRAMHAIRVSVADEMRPGITDPRKAWLTLREVHEHATASKRQCLETEQHGLKRGSWGLLTVLRSRTFVISWRLLVCSTKRLVRSCRGAKLCKC